MDLLLSLSLLLTHMLQLLLVEFQLSSLELGLLPLQYQSEALVLTSELCTGRLRQGANHDQSEALVLVSELCPGTLKQCADHDQSQALFLNFELCTNKKQDADHN